MDEPQQQEVRRSGRGETEPSGRHAARAEKSDEVVKGRTGKVPPQNRPGHHPDKEQDKPVQP
jgi:hypothetical protein